jgi:4-hydroxy-tetrahydrodipicolinate synthase
LYHGIIVPLVTPLDESGAVCKHSVRRLIETIADEVTGLMPTLSSGEGWKLDVERWEQMVAYTKEAANGLPVLAGVQLPDTASVVARARRAAELGVHAVVVTTPFTRGLSQAAIHEHYQTIRRLSSVPLFIYNEASVSQNAIELATLIEICQLPDVVGIKESSGSAEFTRSLIAAQTGVPVFQGWENLFLESQGVDGYVAPLANLDPALCRRMLETPSTEAQAAITTACEAFGLFREDWYVSLKRELSRRGVIRTDKIV